MPVRYQADNENKCYTDLLKISCVAADMTVIPFSHYSVFSVDQYQ
jgi:hypothetical protein